MKLNLGRDSEATSFMERLMFGWDSEDEIWSRFVFELVMWTQPSGPLCLWQCFVCRFLSINLNLGTSGCQLEIFWSGDSLMLLFRLDPKSYHVWQVIEGLWPKSFQVNTCVSKICYRVSQTKSIFRIWSSSPASWLAIRVFTTSLMILSIISKMPTLAPLPRSTLCTTLWSPGLPVWFIPCDVLLWSLSY